MSIPGTWCLGRTGLAAAQNVQGPCPCPCPPTAAGQSSGSPWPVWQKKQAAGRVLGSWGSGGAASQEMWLRKKLGRWLCGALGGATGSLSWVGSQACSHYAVLPPLSRADDRLRLPPDILEGSRRALWGCGELLDELSGRPHPMLLISESLLSICKWDVHLSKRGYRGRRERGKKQSGSKLDSGAPSAGLLLLLRATSGAWSGHSAGLGSEVGAECRGGGVGGALFESLLPKGRVPF